MNERIKQLLYETRIYDGRCGETQGIMTCAKTLNEFAELIVRECIDICLKNHINNIETISAGECAYDIQEHFGVD